MSAARNILRPHMSARFSRQCESCSIVKSAEGTDGMIKIK
jgi:hypothetical protein